MAVISADLFEDLLVELEKEIKRLFGKLFVQHGPQQRNCVSFNEVVDHHRQENPQLAVLWNREEHFVTLFHSFHNTALQISCENEKQTE